MTGAVSVALAGSTGSIGTQTLDVVAAEPDRYRVVALGAGGSHLDLLIEQARTTGAKVVAVADEARAAELAAALPGVDVRAGTEGLASLGAEADVCVNGVVGFAGLHVTLATLAAGRRLALANKESLIAGGPVVRRVRDTPGAELVPVDSEHCAVHLCLRSADPDGPDRVGRIVLTASGGPFRGRTARRAGRGHRRRRPGPPHLVDGPQDHRRLLHPHEQGPRGHRGPRALRRGLRPHRGGGAPAVDRPLHGRVHRRGHHRPALAPRHAPAHRLRPGLARPLHRPGGPHRLDLAVPPRLRGSRPRRLPLPGAGLRRRAGRGRGPGLAQRGQRGRGRGVPRRPHPLGRHP